MRLSQVEVGREVRFLEDYGLIDTGDIGVRTICGFNMSGYHWHSDIIDPEVEVVTRFDDVAIGEEIKFLEDCGIIDKGDIGIKISPIEVQIDNMLIVVAINPRVEKSMKLTITNFVKNDRVTRIGGADGAIG